MVKDKEEAINDSLVYFKGDQLAAETFVSKYAMTGVDGKCESTPDDMHHRMAREYARIEEKYGGDHQLSEDEIYGLFKDFRYVVPGGSVMNGLGNPIYKGSLSNCFVIGAPEDSYGSIMRYREEQVQLMKRRGGVGCDLSKLRPEGTKVNNAAKTSTGPVSFMQVFSELTREVALSGRRGALMISMSGKHPDTIEFIESKQDLSKITGANISVKFDDDFFKAVENDGDYLLRWPVDMDISGIAMEDMSYDTKVWSDDNKQCFKKVRARDVWKKFVHCAWATAEPGVMYEDKHHDLSPDSVYEQYKGVTTNPCGEIFMGSHEACRLMHINLQSFVNQDLTYDYEELEKASYKNTYLCDDLVDLELEHVQDIIKHIQENYDDVNNKIELELWQNVYEVGKSSRRAGCGATGLADAIAKMNLKLNSEEGFETVRKIFRTKMLGELKAQVDLARERGTFVGYSFDKEYEVLPDGTLNGMNPFFQNLYEEYGNTNPELFDAMERYGRRNVSWSTMAPVGTGAIMTQGTSGIEPLFTPYGKRRKKCMSKSDRVDYVDNVGEKFTLYNTAHRPLLEWIMENCPDYDKSKTFDEQATDEKKEKWFKASPWYGCIASDLTPDEHVILQSIVQKYITHSISKTCNLPSTATEDEISELYLKAWKMNCKGVTVYRDGCRSGVLLKEEKKTDDNTNKPVTTLTHSAPKRPKSLPCEIKRFRNGGDKWIACVGLYNGEPYELFTGLAEKLNLPDYVEKCAIIKNKVDKMAMNEDTEKEELTKVSSYDIVYNDKEGNIAMIEDVSNIFRSEFYAIAKLTSGLLRHGMPIENIISTIKSIDFKNESINSWKQGVIRTLRKYIKEDENTEVTEKCPICGAKVIRENGCRHCSECGWSACQ